MGTRLQLNKKVRTDGDLSMYEQRARKEQEEKKIYLDILLDGTYSFTRMFPFVYPVLKLAMYELKNGAGKLGCSLHYGLTVLHEQGEQVSFENGYFTSDLEAFMEAIKNVEFKGGDVSGAENMSDAIQTALRTLGNDTEEYASRGLIILTDSKSKASRENFTKLDDVKYNNLRFVAGYFYDMYYSAVFPIVDADGIPVDNTQNHCCFYSIKSLLENSGVQELVDNILRKVSCSKQA